MTTTNKEQTMTNITDMRQAVDIANAAADAYRDAIMLAYYDEHDPTAADFDKEAGDAASDAASDKAYDLYEALYNAARIKAKEVASYAAHAVAEDPYHGWADR